jgi:4-pyridoxate dehydrogenase
MAGAHRLRRATLHRSVACVTRCEAKEHSERKCQGMDNRTKARGERYDYVIVGAGSAGCLLANRLTADSAVRVLLLEAGGNDFHPYIRVPLGLGMLQKKRLFDWGYDTEPNEHLDGRSLFAPRGKVLGGSSSTNNMAFTRGHRGDYDRWARNGATGWSYDEVLPYFKRIENWEGGESAYRGGSGPVGVQFARTTDPLFDAMRESGRAAGYPVTDDYNGEHNEGFGRSQYSISNGRRASSAVAFLRPAMHRPNLTLKTKVHAHRVLFDGARAVGVRYEQRGSMVDAVAEREVLICAGAFNSPQLLMLSGIGPADHLREHGIEPIADLAVGDNLQDHVGVQLHWFRNGRGPFHGDMRYDRIAPSMLQAYTLGTGPGTVLPSGLHAFLKTDPRLPVPDLELLFKAAPPEAGPWFPGIRRPYADGFYMSPVVLHPQTRGTVRLRSADPRAFARISYRLLAERYDRELLRDGVRRVREISSQAPLAPFRGEERAPGPDVQTDDEIDRFIRPNLITISHPCGTCRMGSDDAAVLDPQLRVRGIDALRVIDASALPDLPGAHINAAVMMVAEKASDLLR